MISNRTNLYKYIKLKHYIIFAVIFCVLIFALLYYYLIYSPPFTVEYIIKSASVQEGTVQVNLTLKNLKNRSIVDLYTGEVKPLEQSFSGRSGEVKHTVYNSYIEIQPLKNSTIYFNYKIKLGELGKHGYRGKLNSDLLTFEGSQVLILPSEAYIPNQKEIKEINVAYDMPDNWVSVIPFEKKINQLNNKKMTVLNFPTWLQIYDLNKSCFAFGEFVHHQLSLSNSKLDIYIDPKSSVSFTDDVSNGLSSIYSYYLRLFGYSTENFSIVLLRNDLKDNSYIMGGSSSQTLGTSFSPENKRDWELMGHRFFHAFFETKVSSSEYHTPPNLWFYEGLATYYENMSMNSLPLNIKNRLHIDVSENFTSIFKRYVYMYYKDPSLAIITPIKEEQYENSKAMTEFLHYTQAPLIIKLIEDSGYNRFGYKDKLLEYIVNNHSKEHINLNDILNYALRDTSDSFSQQYFSTNALLPLWYLSGGSENRDNVKNQLYNFEYSLWTWFNQDFSDYPPMDRFSSEVDIIKEVEEAKRLRIHFTGQQTENKINKVSSTVYDLLLQNALRANICNVKLTDPLLKLKLFGDSRNINLWNDYVKKMSTPKNK